MFFLKKVYIAADSTAIFVLHLYLDVSGKNEVFLRWMNLISNGLSYLVHAELTDEFRLTLDWAIAQSRQKNKKLYCRREAARLCVSAVCLPYFFTFFSHETVSWVVLPVASTVQYLERIRSLFIISYIGLRFTSIRKINFVLFYAAYLSTDINDVNASCY